MRLANRNFEMQTLVKYNSIFFRIFCFLLIYVCFLVFCSYNKYSHCTSFTKSCIFRFVFLYLFSIHIKNYMFRSHFFIFFHFLISLIVYRFNDSSRFRAFQVYWCCFCTKDAFQLHSFDKRFKEASAWFTSTIGARPRCLVSWRASIGLLMLLCPCAPRERFRQVPHKQQIHQWHLKMPSSSWRTAIHRLKNEPYLTQQHPKIQNERHFSCLL